MKIGKLLTLAENEGWIVHSYPPNKHCAFISLEFEKYTDFGNYDFVMSFSIKKDCPEEVVSEIEGYFENFDPEEEAAKWIVGGHGVNGAPHSLKDIIKSMEEAKGMVVDLWRKMKICLNGMTKDVRLFKMNYRNALDETIEANTNDALILTADFISSYQLDGNYYGECFILLGRKRVDVESIWVDGFSDAGIHVNCEAFECDIRLSDLSVKNARRVMRFLYQTYMKRIEDEYYNHK